MIVKILLIVYNNSNTFPFAAHIMPSVTSDIGPWIQQLKRVWLITVKSAGIRSSLLRRVYLYWLPRDHSTYRQPLHDERIRWCD